MAQEGAPPPPGDDLKSQFVTREGTYRLLALADYSRAARNVCGAAPPPSCGAGPGPRLSLVTLPLPQQPQQPQTQTQTQSQQPSQQPPSHPNTPPAPIGEQPPAEQPDPPDPPDRLCFNYGKELYVYVYRGLNKVIFKILLLSYIYIYIRRITSNYCHTDRLSFAPPPSPPQTADLSKPVDKKIYKGTNPTCHDFNTVTTTHNSVSLLIGFSTGQIQILDPIKKEVSKLYNEEVSSMRRMPPSNRLDPFTIVLIRNE